MSVDTCCYFVKTLCMPLWLITNRFSSKKTKAFDKGAQRKSFNYILTFMKDAQI